MCLVKVEKELLTAQTRMKRCLFVLASSNTNDIATLAV